MTHSSTQRRRVLRAALPAVLTGASMGAMNQKLNLIGSAFAATGNYSSLSDYKALVCIFLYGGSDSFNLFVPYEQAGYEAYQSARGQLSLPKSALLPGIGGQVGFNPGLSEVRQLYDTGKLAIVRNVGNLIAPVSRADFLSEQATIPADLFAHNHQQEQIQKGFSSQPQSIVGAGWGGRMADLLMAANSGSDLPPTFSLNGANYFQPGNATTPISVNPVGGPELMPYLDGQINGTSNTARDATLERLLASTTNHPIKAFARDSFTRARDSSRLISQVLASSPAFTTSYDTGSSLAAQLRMVARLIAGRQALGMKRQIFFVGLGGWDTHDNQTPRLNTLVSDLDSSLASFQQTIDELNLANQVTTFTSSDFGRTLTINGDGTDHGWGGHYLVMGGAVNGGQLVGDWPDFEIGGAQDAGDKGRVIPTMSVNQYGGALASWMGLSNADMLDVFPDLTNFPDVGWQTQYGLFRP